MGAISTARERMAGASRRAAYVLVSVLELLKPDHAVTTALIGASGDSGQKDMDFARPQEHILTEQSRKVVRQVATERRQQQALSTRHHGAAV